MAVKEIAKTILVSPAKKLFEVAKVALGEYNEELLKKRADAVCYTIDKVSAAIRSNIDIPIRYEKDGLIIDSRDFQELAQRTGQRLAYQEMTKQQNIESVVSMAYQEFGEDEMVSDEPVDRDWILRLFRSVEDVSDEQMQELWAKVLAGQVKQPGRFSLRTLHTLSNMSKDEAEALQRVAEFTFFARGDCFLYKNYELCEEYDLHKEIIMLFDCGLLSENSDAVFRGNDMVADDTFLSTANMVCVCNNEEPEDCVLPVDFFTSVGTELLSIFDFEQNQAYFLEMFKAMKKEFPQLELTAYSIKQVTDDGRIIYDDENDLLS
jgi:hypothetical protein